MSWKQKDSYRLPYLVEKNYKKKVVCCNTDMRYPMNLGWQMPG